MNDTVDEPKTFSPAIRHDGWTGEVMAKFLETLSETGIVMDACDAAGRSRETAYALRRRNPLFARAWELALCNARDRLADTLLARSIEGNVEQIIKDGVIVAEKHLIDNRLGLAILRRLDKRADEAGRLRRPAAPAPESAEPDWDIALTALRTGDADDIAAALAMLQAPALNSFQGNEADKTDTRLMEDSDEENDSFRHPRIWREYASGEWRTDYPPPKGFSGFEQDDWEDETYCRALTEDELAALIAGGIAEPSEAAVTVSLEDDEAERDEYFATLAGEYAGQASSTGITPAPGSVSAFPGDIGEMIDAGSSPE